MTPPIDKEPVCYLGDGLYTFFDGYHFILIAPKLDGEHRVALEPEVLDRFFKFIERTNNVKIEVKRNG